MHQYFAINSLISVITAMNIVSALFYDKLLYEIFVLSIVYGLHLQVHERRTRQDRRLKCSSLYI